MDEVAQLITSTVNAAASTAGRKGVYTPPPGAPPPRRRRRAASLRHLAEVIRTHRMAPGIAVDKDIVGRVLAGELRHLSDPLAVVAVARASHHIAGVPFGEDDAHRLSVAVEHLTTLIGAAQEADRRAPGLLPVPRPAAALIERAADRQHLVEVAMVVGPEPPARTRRRAHLRLGPAVWAVLLAVFTAGTLTGVTGSRLADSLRPATGASTHTERPSCRPLDEPRPAGSVVAGAPGTPAGESPGPAWKASVDIMGLTPTRTGFVATVPAGFTEPPDLLAIRGGITLIAGHRYRFDFTITGDRRLDIMLRIQDKAPPLFPSALFERVRVDHVPVRLACTFTADTTISATGEVTFQFGGQGAYTVTVDDALLVDTDA